MLDVLQAFINAGTVRSCPLGLLAGLVRKFVAGNFDPTTGFKIKKERANKPLVERKEESSAVIDKDKQKAAITRLRQDSHLR